jgi:hypothetical protein
MCDSLRPRGPADGRWQNPDHEPVKLLVQAIEDSAFLNVFVLGSDPASTTLHQFHVRSDTSPWKRDQGWTTQLRHSVVSNERAKANLLTKARRRRFRFRRPGRGGASHRRAAQSECAQADACATAARPLSYRDG